MALAGAGLLYLYKQRFEAEVGGGDKIEVLVAASDLQLGDTLISDKIATRGIPASYVETRHIHANQINSVMGVRVRSRLGAGETILWSDLAISGANSRDLSGLVIPRMRALAIPASSALTFDGLLRSGDRVDVLLTVMDPRSERSQTYPLLQNLIVLALGQQMGLSGERDSGESGTRISTVTLGVKPTEGQILANAMREGTLTLLLRNVDDIRLLQRGDESAPLPATAPSPAK
jgi:pilus assembly protein CpaB